MIKPQVSSLARWEYKMNFGGYSVRYGFYMEENTGGFR